MHARYFAMIDPVRLAIAFAAVAVALLWPVWSKLLHAARQWSFIRHIQGPPATHWLLGESTHTL
jgi:hypothetical protein